MWFHKAARRGNGRDTCNRPSMRQLRSEAAPAVSGGAELLKRPRNICCGSFVRVPARMVNDVDDSQKTALPIWAQIITFELELLRRQGTATNSLRHEDAGEVKASENASRRSFVCT
eukprot:TRINITY_DN15827_c1_g1_i1.p2 TRINITY_DN15827_c1_g1~~TRINITY_DN15827_c1_g1_i1.p2  ORF type:complete len:116 (-),score=10.22 TRINITY_DN15827_c1_g1_i1:155-502(-)